MADNKMTDTYDDGNIPNIDMPLAEPQDNMEDTAKNSMLDNAQNADSVEPLPEATRPRKDGPGGN